VKVEVQSIMLAPILPEDPGPRATVATWAEADALLATAPVKVAIEYRVRWPGDEHFPRGYGASGSLYYRTEEREPLLATVRRHREELLPAGGDAAQAAKVILDLCLGGHEWPA
jgi:hypothetical protein